MAVDTVQVNSTVGADGNSYTTAVSNDKLTNEDFLKLLLTEMQMQDPTEPMDSQRMMDSQLQMSTIEANLALTESMQAMATAYANTALATSAGMIGTIVENGNINDQGMLSSYLVETIENVDGEIYVNAREIVGLVDGLQNDSTQEVIKYDANGYFASIGNEDILYQLVLDSNGQFTYNDDGTIKMLDENGDEITDSTILSQYSYAGNAALYDTETTQMPLSSIIQVR